jgi:DNA-binding MarR family transcriptional regulator
VQSLLIKYSNKIIDTLKSIQKNLRELIIHKSKDFGFTVPQILLMHELYHHPHITLNELSRRISLSKSTVSGIINRLVQQGIVLRTIPAENRRTVQLSLSPEILKKGEIIIQIKTHHLCSLLKDEDAGKIIKLIDSLEYLDGLLKSRD